MRLQDMLEFISLGFRSDRFKTLMSSLGIIIGVLAIVVMLSVGEGLYSGVSSQFSTLDLDVIHVIPGSARFGGPDGEPGSRNAAEPAKFTDKDTKVLENVVGVKNVAPQTGASVVISFRNTNSSGSLTGVDPDKEQDLKEKVAQGRWLSGSDYRSIVIGNGISQVMFRMKVTPGNKIRLYYRDQPMDFTVVGVLEEEEDSGFGGGMGDSADNAMYVTHKAMEELLDEENYYYQTFQVTVSDPDQADYIIERIINDLITAGGGNRHRQCDDAHRKGEDQGDWDHARPGGDSRGHSQAVSAGGRSLRNGLKPDRNNTRDGNISSHRLSGRAAIVHNPRVDSIGRSVRRPNHHHCRLLSGE